MNTTIKDEEFNKFSKHVRMLGDRILQRKIGNEDR